MNDLRALPPGFGDDPAPRSEAAQESPFVIFQRIHRLLRGRYPYVIGFSLLGAIAGAAGGYMSTKPKYESVGSIHIRPVLPMTLYQTEQNQVPQMFASYVQTQANFLQDSRVIHQAMRSAEWRELGRGVDHEDVEEFKDSLSVVTSNQQPEWIRVKFADREPKAARVAVQQVIAAYTEIYGEDYLLLDPNRIKELEAKKKTEETDIKNRKDRINEIGKEWGTNDLEVRHKASLERLLTLEEEIARLDLALSPSNAAAAPGAEEPAPAIRQVDPDLAAAEIARLDDQMRTLLAQRSAAQAQLDSLRGRFTHKHRSVIDAKARLDAAQTQVTAYADKWLAQNGGLMPGSTVAVPRSPEAVAALSVQRENLRSLYAKAKEETVRLNDRINEIRELNAEIAKKSLFLADIEKRLTQVSTESQNSTPQDGNFGRIRIVSSGEEAYTPAFDSRKKRAAAGLLVGGGLPFAFFLLLGLVDRRYRYSDETAAGAVSPTLLGILPYLPDQIRDPEQAAIAAHCVHQIRTLLQIGGRNHDRRVYAITSPTSGDGKTSLSLSLGLSFANTGARTCLIDFDMVGGGLTAAMQAKTRLGLMDAINQGELNGHVRDTGFPNLYLIPVGEDDAQDVARLSPELVRRVISQAREQFDIVVIDTGPILGSIEAALVSAAVDGVILTLGRGQARPMAERAMDYLNSVGATLMGVVFNRAESADFRRAVSSTSARSVPNQAAGRANRILPAMGPMASTLAADFKGHAAHDDR